MKWLIYGHKGWIGTQFKRYLETIPDYVVVCGKSRVDDETGLREELDKENPDRVLCLIGRTHGEGFSTIDYLEQSGKLVENVRDNLFGPILLAEFCRELGIHLSYMGTGCIFTYDESHTLDNGVGFKETDKPNYYDSSYSVVKGFTDRLMHQMNNTLNWRIRMPITRQDHPRNFISKIIRYEKICSVANSMTVLDELIPIMVDLAAKKEIGTYNMTNPGSITHNEILDLYREFVDKDFTYQNFSIEEQREILRCGRSNNLLSTCKLEKKYPEVKNIRESVIDTLKNWEK